MIVDLFAGPGGWDEGLRLLNVHDVVGLEWDEAACATAEAAGHARHRVDISAADPDDYTGAVGLVASPPCQAFSLAGRQAGLGAVDRLLAHVVSCVDGWSDPPASICGDDVRADLTLQPLRWVDALRPEWVALEQVPGVVPLWRAIGEVFEGWGYTVQVAKLNAANYGVPQTRQRAVLVASRVGRARLPEPTHHDPRKGVSLFGQPWVSMAEALGWGDGVAYVNGNQPNAAVRPVDQPAPTVHFGAAANDVRWRMLGAGQTSTESAGLTPRDLDEPAHTVIGKGTAAWVHGQRRDSGPGAERDPRPVDEPSYTIRANGSGSAPSGVEWVHDRPATTVVSTFRPDVIAAPGWRGPGDGPRQDAPGSVRVTVQEAAVLQAFRPDYPWQGSKTKQYEQVGNAVPPLLAAAVLRPLLGLSQEAAA